MTSPRPLFFAFTLGVGLAVAPAGAEVRIITAPGVVAPRFDAPPSRVAPPPAPAKPPAPIVDRRLGPVVVESGDRLRAGRLHIRLIGVASVAEDETCRDPAGVDWSCGRRSLAGLRMLTRLRPVVCRLPSDARAGTFETSCAPLAGGDLGAMFVASGWARAVPGGPYEVEEARAKADTRGVWAAAPTPAESLPVPVVTGGTEGVPPDLTTAPLSGAGAASLPETGGPAAPADRTAGAPMALGR